MNQVSDEIMAYLELTEDCQFIHIHPTAYPLYITKSMEIAKTAANKYKDSNLASLLKEDSVAVCYHEQEYTASTPYSQIQSELFYTKEKKRIDIYTTILREKQSAVEAFGLSVSLEDLLRLHLAHEFYHFLEFKTENPTYQQLPRVTKKCFGILPLHSYVIRTNEIVAHQFAKELCHFPIHPKLMDYYYLIHKGVYEENQLNRLLQHAQSELNKGEINESNQLF